MATSGTVASYNFTQRKIIEHAARRAGYVPQKLSSEDLQVCQDCLFLQLSEYVNVGFPLWTRQFILLPIKIGSPDVPCPAGTVDVLHSYWRILQPYRGAATTSGNVGTQALFGGQPCADITIAGPNPYVSVNFASPTEVDTVGILLGAGASVTAAVEVQISVDNATFVTFQTLPSATYAPGTWVYFDLDPTLTATYVRVLFPISTGITLNQMNFGLANGQDIENGPLSIDNYYNQPDKQFQASRPNSTYDDRQISAPVLKIWPTPNTEAFYNGTVSALVRRYIQDPGRLTDEIEVPVRWYEGVISRLAVRLMDTLPDQEPTSQASVFSLQAKMQRRQNMDAAASKAESLFWSEERVRAPIQIAPSIGVYTR